MDVVIVIIAYEAAGCIEKLLDRVPKYVGGSRPHLLISDDASSDGTASVAEAWLRRHPDVWADVVCQPENLGYGGNQKFCFERAIRAGADIAVLLHGDEQYPPEYIEDLAAPIVSGDADAVYGSRMMTTGAARQGGMPLNRYLGNVALSRIFNWLVGSTFSEWFSGFRAYRMSTLAAVDLEALPDGFDFDVAITTELVAVGRRVIEVPIPTRYGDELSRVPLLRTSRADLGHALAHRRSRTRRRG